MKRAQGDIALDLSDVADALLKDIYDNYMDYGEMYQRGVLYCIEKIHSAMEGEIEKQGTKNPRNIKPKYEHVLSTYIKTGKNQWEKV